MISYCEPSVGRTNSEFGFESRCDSALPPETGEEHCRWILKRLRSKPHITRVTFDHAGRVDIAVPVTLIPIDSEFHLLPDQATHVDVVEVSNANIVVRHRELFPHREAAVLVLWLRDGSRVPVRVRFTWTRFCRPDTYHSGGRFVVGPFAQEPATSY